MKSKYVCVWVGLIVLCFTGMAYAADAAVSPVVTDEAEADAVAEPVIVTAFRYPEKLSKTAATVSIISSEDIENSHAKTTVELLDTVPGIHVRDWMANGTKASIDMRGFGEQAGLNSLVMVDGRRVNEIDLSGVAWTQIPIEHIEKIEIIRGGSGAVLYGDNAVAGVVNIITKSGAADKVVTGSIETEYGSYDMNKQTVNVGGSVQGLNYFTSISRDGSHEYRNNTYSKGILNQFSKFSYNVESTGTTIRASQGFSRNEYGMPGALSSADIGTFDRRYSAYPDDYAKEKDYFFAWGVDQDIADVAMFSMDGDWRSREAYSNFVGANGGWNPITRSAIESWSLKPKVKIMNSFADIDNTFILGYDFLRADAKTLTDDVNAVLQSTIDINKVTNAVYFQDEFTIWDRLTGIGGFRYEDVKYEFDYEDYGGANPDIDSQKDNVVRAYNLGLNYEYLPHSQIFVTQNTSFRTPVSDEFVAWGSLNPNLKIQEARNWEVGVRHSFNDKVKMECSYFVMNLKNELYYNPTTYANENYGKTRHEGIETSVEYRPTSDLKLFSNYTFTHARFKDGSYKGKEIPMVPAHQIVLGARYAFLEYFSLNTAGQYVDERRFINDQANNFPSLKGYVKWDANLAFEKDSIKVTLGVNNLLNQKYYQYGVSNAATGAVNYYPASGANWYVKLKYTF